MLEIMILVQGFCSLKIKITQFPNAFRLNFTIRLLSKADKQKKE